MTIIPPLELSVINLANFVYSTLHSRQNRSIIIHRIQIGYPRLKAHFFFVTSLLDPKVYLSNCLVIFWYPLFLSSSQKAYLVHLKDQNLCYTVPFIDLVVLNYTHANCKISLCLHCFTLPKTMCSPIKDSINF